MKHKFTIILILLGMFLITQFIGLYIVNSYSPVYNPETNQTTIQELPYGLQPPEIEATPSLISLIIAFVIAITLIMILSKYKWKFLLKAWFFIVVIIALGISFNAILKNIIPYSSIVVLILALPLAFFKIYKPHVLIHNFTELLIYPGIAAVFVPILSPLTIIIFLILISLYDMWAVWHTGIMQKMAKFQMNELQIFGGFLVPYIPKKLKEKLKKLKLKSKKIKGKKIKISLAILGGGDIVFPIITAGVFLRAYSILPAILIIIGAFFGLAFLFWRSEKGKSYPAMPFITSGIFIAIIVSKITGIIPYIIHGIF